MLESLWAFCKVVTFTLFAGAVLLLISCAHAQQPPNTINPLLLQMLLMEQPISPYIPPPTNYLTAPQYPANPPVQVPHPVTCVIQGVFLICQ